MPGTILNFRFKGQWDGYGGAKHYTFTDYQSVPGKALEVQIVGVEDRKLRSHNRRASILGRSVVKVQAGYSSFTSGIIKYDSTVKVQAAYDLLRSEEPALVIKDILLVMEGEGEGVTVEHADVGGKVLDCAVKDIEGAGGQFHVETFGERGIRCIGAFVTEEGKSVQGRAQITLAVVMEED